TTTGSADVSVMKEDVLKSCVLMVVSVPQPTTHPARRNEQRCRDQQLARCQDDHRNEALGLLLVLGELREALGLGAEEALALLPGRLARSNVDRRGPDLDREIGVRLEVVVPVGAGGGSAVRGDH